MSEDLKNIVENKSKSAFIYLKTFLKWLIISSLTGIAGGLIGALFSNTLKEANAVRESIPWIIFFLPLGGVLIAGLYKMCGLENDPGTNIVIQSVRTKENVPFNITTIDVNAFNSCSITNVRIPSTITRIEKGAFKNCKNLEEAQAFYQIVNTTQP